MKHRLEIEYDADTNLSVSEIVAEVARELFYETEGTCTVLPLHEQSFEVKWSIEEVTPGVEVDRRQLEVAALMLMGFNLPQEMGAAAASMIEAARICPGLTTAEFPAMNNASRKACLMMAASLVNQMLAELP